MAARGESLPTAARFRHRRLVAAVEEQDAAFEAVERAAFGASSSSRNRAWAEFGLSCPVVSKTG